jgi:predicted membrane protein
MEEFKGNRRAILGIILILAGMVLIASHMGWIPWSFRSVIFSWQALLIALGVFFILNRESWPAGLILIGVGTFFIIPRVFPMSFEYRRLIWPVLLVAFGLVLITRRAGRQNIPPDSMDYIDDMSIFGGGDKMITSQNFRGGKLTAVFGGSKINLLKADLAKGQNIIDIFAMFGGTKLIIPPGWNIKIEITSIFGGFTDKRPAPSDDVIDPSKELVLKGLVIFGGGDIVSFYNQ